MSGELESHVRASFEQHLAVCPNCVAYLSNYRDTVALGRGAFTDDAADLPADVPDGLVDAILATRRARG
jgi:anti-sigma factor RsiW